MILAEGTQVTVSDHRGVFPIGPDRPAGSDQPHLNHPAAGLPTCVWANAALRAVLSTPRQPRKRIQHLSWLLFPRANASAWGQLRGLAMPWLLFLHLMPLIQVIYILASAQAPARATQLSPSRGTSPCPESALSSAQTLATLSPSSPSWAPPSGHWSVCLVTAFPAQLSLPLPFAAPAPLSCLSPGSSQLHQVGQAPPTPSASRWMVCLPDLNCQFAQRRCVC